MHSGCDITISQANIWNNKPRTLDNKNYIRESRRVTFNAMSPRKGFCPIKTSIKTVNCWTSSKLTAHHFQLQCMINKYYYSALYKPVKQYLCLSLLHKMKNVSINSKQYLDKQQCNVVAYKTTGSNTDFNHL